MKSFTQALSFLLVALCPQLCLAVGSAELYSSQAYGYGRFEARARLAAGDGVVSSFFLWKDGSEKAGTFWNELDFEKLGADCHVETNAIYGNPNTNHSKRATTEADICGAYHTYAYEWTPESIVWLVDGAEIRRETGAIPLAFAQNASGGMQIHFNIWPGDATFGGNFDPSKLPVHEYIDWVQFSAYADGAFKLSWREDFAAATVPEGWLTGSWASPKNKSTHAPENVNFLEGFAVLSLTSDSALGPAGAMPNGGASSGAAGASNAGAGGSSSSSAGSGGSGAVAGGASSAGAGQDAAGATAMGGATAAASGSAGVAQAGAPGSGAASTGTAGAPNDSSGSGDGGGCTLARSPGRSGFLWMLCGLAAAVLYRRARRNRATPRTA